MKVNRFLFATGVMLAMVFAYSCSSTEEKEKQYYVEIANINSLLLPYATMESSYTFFYPYVVVP